MEILSESIRLPNIENKSHAFPYIVPKAIIARLYLGCFNRILKDFTKLGLSTVSAKFGAIFGLSLKNTRKGSDREQHIASISRIISTFDYIQ